MKLLLTLICGIAVVTPSLLHYRSAAASLDASLRRSAAIAADLAEFNELRSKIPTSSNSAIGPADLVDYVSTSLHKAGLAQSTLRTLTPIGPMDSAPASQLASLTLEPLSLEQLGAVLSSLRAAEAGWTVTTIEIAPILRTASLPAAHQPLRATLTIEAPASPSVHSRSIATQPDASRP